MEQVLSMLGIATKQEGQKLRGACPFCKDPRAFVVTPAAGKGAIFLREKAQFDYLVERPDSERHRVWRDEIFFPGVGGP